MAENKYEGGPSWVDVRDWIQDSAKEHNGHVKWECGLDPKPSGSCPFYVKVVFAPTVDLLSKGGTMQVIGQWPSSGHRTMPGLLLELIHRLNLKLDEEMNKA